VLCFGSAPVAALISGGSAVAQLEPRGKLAESLRAVHLVYELEVAFQRFQAERIEALRVHCGPEEIADLLLQSVALVSPAHRRRRG
jgi:shikimate kinase